MKENSIEYLWFDIGYTLLYLKREEVFFSILGAETSDVPSFNEVSLAFHLTDKLFMREYRGVLGTDKNTYLPWYFGHLFFILGMKADLCGFFKKWKKSAGSQITAWHLCPGVKETLNILKNRGFKLGVISNWDSSARDILMRHGIADLFSWIIISSEEGVEKPSKEIFDIALKKSGADPAKSLYIGDNYYDDVIGSRKVGMDSVIINRFGRKGIEEISDAKIIKNILELPNLI